MFYLFFFIFLYKFLYNFLYNFLLFFFFLFPLSVDVIGMFTAVGTERELEKAGKKTKMNVILIEVDG